MALQIDTSGTILFRQQIGLDVQYSIDGSSSWLDISAVQWPVTLNNTDTSNTLEVQFTTDLSFNLATQYFIIDSSNITIDGSSNVVYVDVSTNNYPGLIQNGKNGSNDYSYVTIQNIGVLSSYSLADGGGWVGQQFFGNNTTDNSIINCYSTGNMGLGGGGIVGGTSNVYQSVILLVISRVNMQAVYSVRGLYHNRLRTIVILLVISRVYNPAVSSEQVVNRSRKRPIVILLVILVMVQVVSSGMVVKLALARPIVILLVL